MQPLWGFDIFRGASIIPEGLGQAAISVLKWGEQKAQTAALSVCVSACR